MTYNTQTNISHLKNKSRDSFIGKLLQWSLITLALISLIVLTVHCGSNSRVSTAKPTDNHNHDRESGGKIDGEQRDDTQPGHENENEPEHKQETGMAQDHAEENGGKTMSFAKHIELTPEMIKQCGIRSSNAIERDYIEKITMTGIVEANKAASYIINTRVPGVVASLLKDTGDGVGKGDVLCVIDSPELLELKTSYVKVFQDYRQDKDNYRRAQTLSDMKALEKKELMTRETAYKKSMADFLSLEARLGSLGFHKETLQKIKDNIIDDNVDALRNFLSPYYSILSPAPGKVISRELQLGERIEIDRVIFEVSDMRKIWVILDAMEKDIPSLEKNKQVGIETDVYAGRIFNGRIITVMEKIDPSLRTLKVRIEVDNREGFLKPQMFVRGQIDTTVKNRRISIPSTALVKISGIDGVFVNDGVDFIFKPVKLIDTDSEGFAFVVGLKPGEKVVIEGAFYLRAEYEIQSGGSDPHAGHGH